MRAIKHRQGRSVWHFNMTPLIDVTFLLLTYFMLASHYASAEKPDMALPQPSVSQATDRTLPDKIIINMLDEGPGQDPAVMYGPLRLANVEALQARLVAVAKVNPKVEVILRADRKVRYGDVRQVMEAIAAANLSRLQVSAELDQTR